MTIKPMSLVERVTKILKSLDEQPTLSDTQVLQDAERLSDEFPHIKPEPYVVPMERFVGLPLPKKPNS
jgi:hypothetical protein